MKLKIRLKFIIFLIFALTFIILGGTLFLSKAESDITWENIEVDEFLQKDFRVNETVDLPIAKQGDKLVTHILYSPSGEGYVSEQIRFMESGEWKLLYNFPSGDKYYTFLVQDILYSINGTNSLVSAGMANDFTQYNANGKSGTFVKIYEKESITYKKKIDLTDKGADDVILSISTLPEIMGTADADRIVVSFTDVYDASNVVTVMLKHHKSTTTYYNRYTYVEAAATGQEGEGLEKQTNGDFVYEGQSYGLHKGFYSDDFGTLVIFSMTGWTNTNVAPNADDVGLESFDISFDYDQRRVYGNGNLIIDLDDPTLQSVLWGGFTTGECYLTIYADTYNKVATNLLINQIDGQLVNDIIAKYDVPDIQLKDNSFETVKNITIGKKFPVPEAYATDVLGNELNVTVRVYTAYKLGAQANVAIVDGCFIPLQERDYYVVYDCIDKGGNHSQRVLIFKAVEDEICLSANFFGYVSESTVGETVEIATPVFDNCIGYVNVKVVAKKGNESILIAEYSTENAIPMLSFTPVKTGIWTIEYNYSDKYSESKTTYFISVKSGGKNFFVEKPIIPKFIIKDATYNTSFIKGYDFANGDGVLKTAKLYLSSGANYSNGFLLEEDTFTISQTWEKVYFTYVIGNYSESFIVPVIDVSYGQTDQAVEKYFYGYSGTPTFDADMGAIYNVKKQDGKYCLSFINVVQCYEFAFGFRIPENARYNKVSIYMEDSADADNVLKCSIYRYNNKNYFCINDGSGQQIKSDYNESITIRYLAEKNLISLSGGESKYVFTNYNGEKWNGFSMDTCWLTVELEGANETSNEINIERVNNQLFYKYKKFIIFDEKPEIYQHDISGDNSLGNIVTLPKIVVADVFASYFTVKLIVKTPTDNYVVSEDGVLLDETCNPFREYSFALKEYGSYYIAYSVEDELGGTNYFKEYNINVIDNVAPEVFLDTTKNIRFELGETIKIVDYTIKDDVTASEECKVFIVIARPDLQKVVFENDTSASMRFDMKGEYIIWISVTDEANNMTFASYKVDVL